MAKPRIWEMREVNCRECGHEFVVNVVEIDLGCDSALNADLDECPKCSCEWELDRVG